VYKRIAVVDLAAVFTYVLKHFSEVDDIDEHETVGHGPYLFQDCHRISEVFQSLQAKYQVIAAFGIPVLRETDDSVDLVLRLRFRDFGRRRIDNGAVDGEVISQHSGDFSRRSTEVDGAAAAVDL
jgi:hypothetical protein